MKRENHPLRVGCQTYTWEMHGPAWQGSPDNILDAIAAAGYAGVEFSNAMIGAVLRSARGVWGGRRRTAG